MEIKIRKAKIDDLKEIQKLNLKLFEKEYNEYDSTFNLNWTKGDKGTKYYSNSITNTDACTLIATSDNKIIGYLVGWIKKHENPCRTIGKQAELENMFILKEFRNKKIGLKLVQSFFEWSKEKNVKNICVTASAENHKAINFYKKTGFKDYDHTLEINL